MVRKRKTMPGTFIQVDEADLPGWMRAVVQQAGLNPAPFVTQVRYGKPFGGTFEPCLDELAAQAEQLCREQAGNPLPLLLLLHHIPWFVGQFARYPWMADVLRKIFHSGNYGIFRQLEAKLGKRGSDSDQQVLYRYRAALGMEGLSEKERLLAVGRSFDPHKSIDAVRHALKRALAAPSWQPVFAGTGGADGAEGAVAGAAAGPDKSDGDGEICRCGAEVLGPNAAFPADGQASSSGGGAATTLPVSRQHARGLVAATGSPAAKGANVDGALPHVHCQICGLAALPDHPFMMRLVLVERPEPSARRKDFGIVCRKQQCQDAMLEKIALGPPGWWKTVIEMPEGGGDGDVDGDGGDGDGDGGE